MVAIQRGQPGCNMVPGKPGISARVTGVDRNGLLQEAPGLVKLGAFYDATKEVWASAA